MRIGVSTASFYSKELTENSFKILHDLKIPLCEVFLSTLSEYEEDFVKFLSDVKGDTEVYSVHTLTQQYEPELFNIMPRTRNDCEAILKKAAHAADILDAKYYIFHGPASYKPLTQPFNYEKLGKRVEEIRQIVLNTSRGKTDVCYENVFWAYFRSPDYFTKIKEFTDVKACLDIKQAQRSGFDVYEYLLSMKNRLTNIHLCDYNEQGQTTLPGKGKFDFLRLFKELRAIGYDGAAMIEVYSGDYLTYDELARSYDFLNECVYKAWQ